jgi:hypothetical protein
VFSSASGAGSSFNRNSSDGYIIQLGKDGSPVGSIGTNGDYPYFTNTTRGIKMVGSAVFPSYGAGTTAPDLVDIGGNSSKFKDLYLSNQAFASYFGSSGDTNTYIYFPTGDQIRFINGGGESARFDSSGTLLVGTTDDAPGAGNTISGVAIRGGSDNRSFFSVSSNYVAAFNRNTNDGNIVQFAKDGTTVGSIGTGGGDLNIGTGDTRIRFNDATDNLIPLNASNGYRDGFISLGDSGARFKDLYLSGIIYGVQQTLTRDSGAPLELNRTTNDGELVYFKQGGIVRGSISISGSTTSYNTTSDYRLKENVVAMSGATERLKQLAPKRFNFIADADTTVDGFLAHEVADVVPEAITGAKDAMRDEEYEVTPAVLDDDGNVVTEAVMGTRSVPDYQGIDQSKLVPLLVATIQELEARIAALESN